MFIMSIFSKTAVMSNNKSAFPLLIYLFTDPVVVDYGLWTENI